MRNKKNSLENWKERAEKITITIYQLREDGGHISSIDIDGKLTKESRESVIEKMIGEDAVRPNIVFL